MRKVSAGSMMKPRLAFPLLLLMLAPTECFAYIDPNAGGWLLQIIFPFLIAIGAAWNFILKRGKSIFEKILRRKKRE
jgi:hypothetical protein